MAHTRKHIYILNINVRTHTQPNMYDVLQKKNLDLNKTIKSIRNKKLKKVKFRKAYCGVHVFMLVDW